ncbi:hypothetical protein THAOC_13828, partial [Thalassiosira oceanica]
MTEVGQTRTGRHFFSTMKIEVPDRLGKWFYGKPSAWGSRNCPQNGPWRPARRAIVEIRLRPRSETAPKAGERRPAAAARLWAIGLDVVGILDLDEVGRRNCTKSSFPESSRRAPQVTANRNRRIQRGAERTTKEVATFFADTTDSKTSMTPMTPSPGPDAAAVSSSGEGGRRGADVNRRLPAPTSPSTLPGRGLPLPRERSGDAVPPPYLTRQGRAPSASPPGPPPPRGGRRSPPRPPEGDAPPQRGTSPSTV